MRTTTTAGPGRPAGIRTRADGLTDRQAKIVATIRRHVTERGYPPSMREIGQAAGLASTSSVAHQLSALERKGILERDPCRPRAYRIRADRHHGTTPNDGPPSPGTAYVPLVGRIAAGTPILAEQHVEDVLPLPRQLVGEGDLFVLTVVGESMIDAHIADGDQVVVRAQPEASNGDIVAAMIDGDATVKRFKRQGSDVWLLPENERFAPIRGNEATILGKVTAVLRAL
ncbi:transcriptional repressor LexA [Streptomyces candidus]|uniref:LexA repressor n=1 Tax=Streptomyces candidus TaxID=67283 RepID=A0A7X0LPK6_9ACTN|nr:transcriptional repressor LexA [Streptomyces candidus]MBB6436062.1 repressor LexA [Streptomyces candidus]GHH43506.1 LexA repressor [Streptomyces candidus]